MAKDFRFIGMMLPNGVYESKNGKDEEDGRTAIFTSCLNINAHCRELKTEKEDGTPLDESVIKENYDNFYKALRGLRHFFDPNDKNVQHFDGDFYKHAKIEYASNPLQFSPNDEQDLSETYADEIKELKAFLWDALFPPHECERESMKSSKTGFKTVNPKSNVSHAKVSKIHNLLSDAESDLLSRYSIRNEKLKAVIADYTVRKAKSGETANGTKQGELTLDKKFAAINAHARSNQILGINENRAFVNKYFDKGKKTGHTYDQMVTALSNSAQSGYYSGSSENQALLKEFAEALVRVNELTIARYISEDCTEIDIDEVIHNFNAITREPILMKIMGLSMDFKITLQFRDMDNDAFDFSICGNDNPDLDVKFLPTPITRIRKKVRIKENNTVRQKYKYAYLVKEDRNSHFLNTILKSDYSSLIMHDKVSKLQQLEDYAERIKNGRPIEESEHKEALTRGIIFTNSCLAEINQPVDIVAGSRDSEELIPGFTDQHVVSGHRVAVKIDDKALYSLTARSLELFGKNKSKRIYSNKNHEGCIHIDAPMTYVESGQAVAATSDALFEYSGELLTLKSAFSKAATAKEQVDDEHTNFHDSGLKKSMGRFKDIVSFHHFPLLEIPDDDTSSEYAFLYGIPKMFNGKHAPKLRFGHKYTFYVYQQYINGWGLPLLNTGIESQQLSVQEIAGGIEKTFEPEAITFMPLENKKAVELFHRFPVHDDASQPLEQRASLEHMVVRSENGDSFFQKSDERHVLPPKIDLESGFWYGLLSEPHMSSDESFDLKRRSNCPFHNEEEYDKYTSQKTTDNQTKKCIESCHGYCGGTQMKPFHPEKHISPPYLTDPTLKTLKVELFWDEGCQFPVPYQGHNDDIKFGGQSGVKPKSILLRANGTDGDSHIDESNFWKTINVNLKKGMNVYARLVSEASDEEFKAKENLLYGWWMFTPEAKDRAENQLYKKYADYIKKQGPCNIGAYADFDLVIIDSILKERNVPKKIQITHAVKEPLFAPQILGIASGSIEDSRMRHLGEWLKKQTHGYEIGKNIIGIRIGQTSEPLGSTFAQVCLKANFERLDAMDKKDFLRDALPTGSLELWMRKEEFEDNPHQVVFANPQKRHLPSDPIHAFGSDRNKFNLEHSITFNNDILAQLKNASNVDGLKNVDDAFRAIISELMLECNLGSSKYEEREYYLKNQSKFKGFFSDEILVDDENQKAIDKLEAFALPKIETVMQCLDKDSIWRFKVMVLNNAKPKKPGIAYVVTTIQEERDYPDRKKTTVSQQGNILTVYLKRGRLTSGKDERVGITVDSGKKYSEILKNKNQLSMVGRDFLSDRYSNAYQYLRSADIVIPTETNLYQAEYDQELGIIHYLPQFDIEKQLWKFEVELNIRTLGNMEMHNPFINLSLLHFQPFSLNYNEGTNLDSDCRISEIENSVWCYLLPKRKLNTYFDKPNLLFDRFGYAKLSLDFDYESLHHFHSTNHWIVRTNFIATVQGTDNGIQWYNLKSWTNDTQNENKYHHGFLSKKDLDARANKAELELNFTRWDDGKKQNNRAFTNFRVRIVEVEWFDNETWDELLENKKVMLDAAGSDIVDNENMRIRYVELIY